METNTSSALFSLNIDPVTKNHLSVTARWARFLAIIGMVVLLLGLVVTIMSATVFTTFFGVQTGNENVSLNTITPGRIGFIVAALVMTLLVFFPLLYLLRFSGSMLNAIRANDQRMLNESFQNLKVYFRYLGILTITFMVLYGVIIAIGIMGLAANG